MAHVSPLKDSDGKKKKEKEDVAEILGKRSGKKKKGALGKAEQLGPPTLGKAVNPFEKKPLNALVASAGLKPVASLGVSLLFNTIEPRTLISLRLLL